MTSDLWKAFWKTNLFWVGKGKKYLEQMENSKGLWGKKVLGWKEKLQDQFGWSFVTRGQNQRKSETKQKLNSIAYITTVFFSFLIMVRLVPFFSKLFILYWGIANWQCCDSFRWTVKGLSHRYTQTLDFKPSLSKYQNFTILIKIKKIVRVTLSTQDHWNKLAKMC